MPCESEICYFYKKVHVTHTKDLISIHAYAEQLCNNIDKESVSVEYFYHNYDTELVGLKCMCHIFAKKDLLAKTLGK